MSLRSNIGLPLLLVATLAFPALALSAASPPALPQEDPDEVCEAAIESQVWEDVIAKCEPLLSAHDESHPSYEFYKENVDYAHTTINYQNQQQCMESAQAGAWDTTLTACPAILGVAPDFFVAHLFLGFAHQAKGDGAEAMSSFEEFLAAADANPEMAAQLGDQINLARRNVAIAKSEMGDRAAAIPLLRQVAEADPSDAEAHFRLGYALLQEDDDAGAEESFAAVINLNPDIPQLPQVLFLAGQLAYNAQEFESAAGAAEQVPRGGTRGAVRHRSPLDARVHRGTEQRRERHDAPLRRGPRGGSQQPERPGRELLAGRDRLQPRPVQHRGALLPGVHAPGEGRLAGGGRRGHDPRHRGRGLRGRLTAG